MDKEARVLLVDDEPELLEVMRRMLIRDFEVVATDQVYEAIRLISTETFAVLIVDLVMPELSGLDLLRRVKQISPRTEVIIVTGYATIRTTKQALRSGAYDYLERPFSRTELQHVVRNAIIRYQIGHPPSDSAQANQDAFAQLLERVQRLEERLTQETERTFQNMVNLLYQVIGVQQYDTMIHLRSVEDYALPVGRHLGLDEKEQQDLRVAAAFHDIGKLGVDRTILYKPGPLTEEEWDTVRRHPIIGAQIVRTVSSWQDAALGVLYHQERMDGDGYPERLEGEAIPIIARIVAVADAYDAMTSDRSYKIALSRQDAIDELLRNQGTQFDPEVVEAFVAII